MWNSLYPRLLETFEPFLKLEPDPAELVDEEPGPYFVCLGAGRNQLPLIQAATAAGYRVIAVDQDPMAPGFETAHIRLHSSILKPGYIYRQLREHLGGEHIAGVATRSFDQANICAAHLARYYNNLGANPNTLRKFRDKRKFKSSLKGRDITLPQSYAWDTMRGKWEMLDASMPLIARPAEGHGKVGVELLNSREDVQAFLKKHSQDKGEILVEDFIGGDEVTVLGLVHQSRYIPVSISDKITSGEAPLFIEIMHRFPSRIPDEARARINKAMQHIVKSSGLRSGPIVAEFIMNSRGTPYLVECVPEAGGEYIAELVASASGDRDFFTDMVNIAAGNYQAPDDERENPGASVIIRYIAQREGILRDIHVPGHIRNDPRLIHAAPLKQVGDKLSLQGGNHDRPFVFALRDEVDRRTSLEQLANRFAEEITIEYEPSVERPLRKTKSKTLVSR